MAVETVLGLIVKFRAVDYSMGGGGKAYFARKRSGSYWNNSIKTAIQCWNYRIRAPEVCVDTAT